MSNGDIRDYMTKLLGLKDVKLMDYRDSKDANSVLTDIENRFQNGYSEIIWFNGHYVNYAGNLSSYDKDGIQYYKFGFISEGDYQEDIFTEDGINKNLTFSIYGR